MQLFHEGLKDLLNIGEAFCRSLFKFYTKSAYQSILLV